ncbi:hypothetical protein L6272_01645 [Microgenomates group bacterium]|nr:hypothetical protein [Microgenomates group bacterium]
MIINIILGGIVGWFLPALDKIAYIYILHPEAQISQYLKFQLEKRQWKSFWETLKSRQAEFDKLTTRGILFQAAWLVLAVFTVTSVPGWFGRALVMVLGIRILLEEWRDWLKNKDVLRQKLFWQIKKEWQNQELKWYLIGKTITVSWLCLLLVR